MIYSGGLLLFALFVDCSTECIVFEFQRPFVSTFSTRDIKLVYVDEIFGHLSEVISEDDLIANVNNWLLIEINTGA